MQWVIGCFRGIYGVVALLFAIAAVGLSLFAVPQLFVAATERDPQAAIEAIGLLAVALVALEIAQTVFEEEVVRKAHISAPTRVRRYLSRFLVVVIVALGVETLVSVMKAMRHDPAAMPYAASVGLAAAALLAAWGAFIWFNRSAEELEPEAMQEAKREDRKLK